MFISHLYNSEVLYEDDGFPERELAALVASKVYYHLGEFADSLAYALNAGTQFDVNLQKSAYVNTIIGWFGKTFLR